jgi:hypothetical protein
MHPLPLLLARLLLVGAFLIMGYAWGEVFAPWLAGKSPWVSTSAWRTLGFFVLFVLFLPMGVALANVPVIPDPCETCKAVWPEWMCWLNCNL